MAYNWYNIILGKIHQYIISNKIFLSSWLAYKNFKTQHFKVKIAKATYMYIATFSFT